MEEGSELESLEDTANEKTMTRINEKARLTRGSKWKLEQRGSDKGNGTMKWWRTQRDEEVATRYDQEEAQRWTVMRQGDEKKATRSSAERWRREMATRDGEETRQRKVGMINDDDKWWQ